MLIYCSAMPAPDRARGDHSHARSNPSKPNAGKEGNRIRTTNKALDAQRFSSVKVPRSAEVQPSKTLAPELRAGAGGRAAEAQSRKSQDLAGKKPAEAFDPIPNDGTFIVVEESKYWPPPAMSPEQLKACGMDLFDRREDEHIAKRDRLKAAGELRHPKGRGSTNSKVTFSDNE